jgi:hypothetical protein
LVDDVTLARAIHVIAVVFWIGGLAMVLLPAVRRFKWPEERVVFFESVERRFARQSRGSTLVGGFERPVKATTRNHRERKQCSSSRSTPAL